MDPSRNPYAPSAASLAGAEVRVGARLWRLEKLLIMARDDGDLPNRCVKCNEAAEEPTKTRTLYWHHPGFYVVLLINIIAYVIVALIARKKAKLSPGLCARHKQKRVLGLWTGWGLHPGFHRHEHGVRQRSAGSRAAVPARDVRLHHCRHHHVAHRVREPDR